MPVPALTPVASSYVDALGYDDGSMSFYVQWKNGTVSRYADVPAGIASDVMNAQSIGQAIHRQIKGRYQHEYVQP